MCRLRRWFDEAVFPKGKPEEETLTHAQKRKRILAQRKANKKSFRRYCKEVRRWRECKHVLSERYGTISVALLCDPWVFRSLLFFHVLLTSWISIMLRANTTQILEEKSLRFMAKEMKSHFAGREKSHFVGSEESLYVGSEEESHYVGNEEELHYVGSEKYLFGAYVYCKTR